MDYVSISFSTELSNQLNQVDVKNQTTTVYIELDNGYIYFVHVSTCKYIDYLDLEALKNSNGESYYLSSVQHLIIETLDEGLIRFIICRENTRWLERYAYARQNIKGVELLLHF
jgi:hypothetical protein